MLDGTINVFVLPKRLSMKNLKLSILMIACACSIVFLSCRKETSVSTKQTSSLRGASQNSLAFTTQLRTTVFHFDTTINYPDIFGNAGFWNPCTNDSMYVVAGSLLIHIDYSIKGERLNGIYHQGSQGVTLVGSSGLKYQMVFVQNASTSSQGFNGDLFAKLTVTNVGEWKFVSQRGSSFNFFAKSTFHITINANGVLTVVHTSSIPTLTCT
jgi:hypothetical protein